MIKNLLFDLGGVIMDIRRENCIRSFRRLGMDHPEELLGEYVQKGPFALIEEGRMTPEEWRDEMRRYIPAEVSDNDIDNAFLDFLVGIPVERLRSLEQLHKRFNIYMLSNTNPIMWNSRISEEFRKDGHDRDYYFDGCLTSFEAKTMKPAAEIFDLACKKFAISPEETLFLDDSQANVDAARRLGFQAAVVEPGTEFSTLPQLK